MRHFPINLADDVGGGPPGKREITSPLARCSTRKKSSDDKEGLDLKANVLELLYVRLGCKHIG